MNDEGLHDLARRAGISTEWQDYAGRPHKVSPQVLRHVLAALDLPANTNRELSASRRSLARRTGLIDLAPLVTGIGGRPTRLDVGGNEAQPARLTLESGEVRSIALLPARGRLRIPAIAEVGYHRMRVEEREIVVAIAPPRCRTIEDVVPDARLWGTAVQLYATVSDDDRGIGDASGLTDLVRDLGHAGADAVAISPVHALFASDPSLYSPYTPSSRLFLNPLHAAPALVFGADWVAHVAGTVATGQAVNGALIDWPLASAAKYAVLRAMFDAFVESDEWFGQLGGDFARFRAERGDLLHRHACFEALHAEQMPEQDWRRWPIDLRDANGPSVRAFCGSRPREVLFHSFLQWVTDRSMAIAQREARRAGMRIGIVGDLAVGMSPAGSYAWSRPSDVLPRLQVGAPPDLLNPRGQNWGLTGFSPRAMEATGFSAFIETLRAVMRNVGGVRIDHAMGLARLWVIPEGAEPADGAFLNYPVGDLLRLLALESVRHSTVVIGEDLGTVPSGFHDMIEQSGIHGMRCLWFEQESNGNFRSPRGWDRNAVAMTSTHDLATVAGWWRGDDIVARAEHGRLGEGVSAESVQEGRAIDRPALWSAFKAESLVDGDPPAPDDPEQVVDAAGRFVARTEAPLCLVPIEDITGQTQQPNLPGTVDEYPNWRIRSRNAAKKLLQEPAPRRRIELLAGERPRL